LLITFAPDAVSPDEDAAESALELPAPPQAARRVRLEVHVRKDDAALVRGMVKALGDQG